ncbi:MAG: hypothetical protein FWE04_05970 [Oscillospiraceae bacterium]|nr:hypothetical protein [Oscillospiraceae bacterium]
MNSRTKKIVVDILMTIFLILSFVRWEDSNFAFHAIVGMGCALFFTAHIFIHRKWLKAVTKSCFAGKLNKNLRRKHIVNIILLVVWGISIVTGFLAIIPFFRENYMGFAWGRLHGITARIGLALIVIHIIQHLPQIKSYLGIKKRSNNERSELNAKNAILKESCG